MKAVICENCNEEFKGRYNKKFCSSSCKNQFHNQRNKEKNALFTALNRQLQRNYSVLNQTFDIYRSSPVKLEVLEKQGFSTDYHTHNFNAPDGSRYVMVYDLGYKHSYDNQVQIVQMEVELN